MVFYIAYFVLTKMITHNIQTKMTLPTVEEGRRKQEEKWRQKKEAVEKKEEKKEENIQGLWGG